LILLVSAGSIRKRYFVCGSGIAKELEMDMSGRVAVIGMGQMGSGMAGRLRDSGLDVVGYDLNADQSARLSADGFRMTSNIAEALSGSEFVLTSLPDTTAVTNAWLATDGIGALVRTAPRKGDAAGPPTLGVVSRVGLGG
jgi:phosphoglycerate dehydrogenase-like enzyme